MELWKGDNLSRFTPTPPRGMRDLDPEEMARLGWVSNRTAGVLRRYGFRLVEPTPIESLETLEAKCGPAVKDEIYWFEDKAGRRLGLRFDLTVGLSRMVALRPDLPLPYKVGAISNMWRYDEPQYGRYRCFYQWDAEIYGSPEVEADAEVIALTLDVLEGVGLKGLEARIGNRRIAEAYLKSLGLEEGGKVEGALRIIDKRRKADEKQLLKELREIGLETPKAEGILGFSSLRGEPEAVLAELAKALPEGEQSKRGLKELTALVGALGALGRGRGVLLDMSVVRGIGYYDGVVFEVFDPANEEVGAIAGGGRFDGLCKIYGRDLPAVGVAGGMERLLLAMEKAGLSIPASLPPTIFVASVGGEDVRREAAGLAQKLRGLGLEVDYDLRRRPLTKQLEYADGLGVDFAVIVGARELERGVFKLRDMKGKREEELTFKDLASRLKG